jgi:hypothetical protein
VVGSADIEPGTDPGRSEGDQGLARFVATRCPLAVDRVLADPRGGIRIRLERGYTLEVLIARSAPPVECWRFFRPGVKGDHLVVGPGMLLDG